MAEAALFGGGNLGYHSCHLQDPSGKIAARWQSKGNLGIVLQEFRTLQSALPGQWEVRATINVGLIYLFISLMEFCLAVFYSFEFTKLFFSRVRPTRTLSLWIIMVMLDMN